MARRLKSPRRSRVEHPASPGQPRTPPTAAATPPRPGPVISRRDRIRAAPETPAASTAPATTTPVLSDAEPASHAPAAATGWNWFAQWRFPPLFFLASCTLALGICYWQSFRQQVRPRDPATAPAISPSSRPRLITSESFDWLYRLRETEVVTGNLEKEFTEAQQFYQDNPVDEFLELDPWALPTDQLAYLRHFCEKGFFTVEREILLKLLERQFDHSSNAAAGLSGASNRLAQAVTQRETRLLNLREAVDLYRRGRDSEVIVPVNPTPEQDQALRAEVVDRLAAVRRQRESLDARITELKALLNPDKSTGS